MMHKIKVLHVGLDTHLGGIETYLLKITSHINRDKFEFSFLAYKGTIPFFYKELSNLGCKFYFITSRRENWLKNKKELHDLFQSEKFDIVHCHLNSLSYITPCLEALKCDCKVIVHSRNAGCLQSKKSQLLHKINFFRLPKRKITCVAVSDLAGKWMFGKNTPFLVLNNGIDTEKYSYNENYRKEIRKEFGLSDNNELLLHVGAFRPQKNHEFLIDIFYEYQKEHSNSLLLLVGDGILKQKIIDKVKELGLNKKVIFAGQRDNVYKIVSAADKFLLPSVYEGFPNVLLEAETSGLICYVSDTITKQAVINGLCEMIELNHINKWIQKITCEKKIKREECYLYVQQQKLDIDSEIDRISCLYQERAVKRR